MDLLHDAVSDIIRHVEIASTITPSISIDPFPNQVGHEPDAFSKIVIGLLKPTIYVDTSFGQLIVAPGGRAEKSYYIVAVIVGVAILALATYGAYSIASK